ncbi:MAG: hypothetical protein OHK0045_25920 [Raineya sp.]
MEFIQEFSKNRDASSLQEALRIKELETIIKICDEFKTLNSDISPFIYFKKAQALLDLGRQEEGLRVLLIAQDIFEENYGKQEQAHSWSKEVSDLYLQIILQQAKRNTQNPNRNLWLYNEAYQLTKEPEQRYEFKQLRYAAYQDLINSKQALKRFAYIEDDLPSIEPQLISPLLSNDVGNIQLVGASPHKNSFWVSHPFKKRLYYYFENALQLAFNDYLNEFVQLMQHLGASQITLEYTDTRQGEGKEDPAAEKLPDDISQTERGRKANFTSFHYEFQPRQKAHLPTHLAWYASQPEWQSLVAERSQGSITDCSIVLSADGILYLSNQELEDAQEELNELIENNFKNYKNDSNKQKRRQRKIFRQDTPTQSIKKDWKGITCLVKVKFAPLSELLEEVNPQTLQILDMELPEPSSESRKMTSVDVSSIISEVMEKIELPKETQAEKKEEKQSPIKQKEAREKLPEEETAYDKWKKLTKEDNKKNIEETELAQPVRERGNLDEFLIETTLPKEKINPQKVEEKQKKESKDELTTDSQGLSQEERFYYEMLQHAYQDGAISDDVRKVLERRRVRFKISEERAKEIEKMMLEKK